MMLIILLLLVGDLPREDELEADRSRVSWVLYLGVLYLGEWVSWVLYLGEFERERETELIRSWLLYDEKCWE